jgi:hypothetical protein
MTTTTDSGLQRQSAGSAGRVVASWLAAALFVYAGHTAHFRPHRAIGELFAIAGVFLIAYIYSRLTPHLGVSHGLAVGIAWLALSLAVEIAVGTQSHRGWFALIGAPDRPVMRNVMLFVWAFAPAVFARGDERW